jgi:hypothetical protein
MDNDLPYRTCKRCGAILVDDQYHRCHGSDILISDNDFMHVRDITQQAIVESR